MILKAISRIRRRAALVSDEGGFTIVEGLIAGVILVLGALAIYDSYDAGTRGTFRAQVAQIELAQAQQQMELYRSYQYDEVTMTSLPNHDPDPTSPFYRVQGGSFDLDHGGTPNFAPLVVNGGTNFAADGPLAGGLIDPTQRFDDGNVHGTLYSFVVWQKDNGCLQPTCTGQDIKRVIILAQADPTAAGGTPSYLEIHSDFTDKEATPQSSVTATGTPKTTAQQFWLSDTPCDPNGPTQRLPITAAHPLHNTLGVDCSNGPQIGIVSGAADALVTNEPPGSKDDPFFDYQSDSPGTGKEGIQLWPETQGTPQCKWGAAGSTDPQTRFHVWMSDEIDPQRVYGNGPFQLNGPVSLSFFSKTVGPTSFPGKICIWLFSQTRGGGSAPKILDGTPDAPTWTWQAPGSWPNDFGDPNEPPVALVTSTDIGQQQVPPNSRLGLAISVTPSTPGPLELMYDHPQFPSVLSVDTSTYLG
jgi:hypothetical protein